MNDPIAAVTTPIGPGRLVVVVGPSGAGKDTVISVAQAACRDNPLIVFPRRVVTRASSASEEHFALAPAAFDDAIRQGAFSFWWQAHGLKYGIPRATDDDIAAGRAVVCNVSRAIVDDLRLRYARVTVVLITAPVDVLAERLQGRARVSDGRLSDRLKRNESYGGFEADVVIENVGPAEEAARLLLAVLAD